MKTKVENLIKLVNDIIEKKSNMILNGEIEIGLPTSAIVRCSEKYLKLINEELKDYLVVPYSEYGYINGIQIDFEFAENIKNYEIIIKQEL